MGYLIIFCRQIVTALAYHSLHYELCDCRLFFFIYHSDRKIVLSCDQAGDGKVANLSETLLCYHNKMHAALSKSVKTVSRMLVVCKTLNCVLRPVSVAAFVAGMSP